ncbi:MAG: NACHT domain-containing protein [Leptolyngbyaceae cyanobacterium bins.302]|nr:NACHT domain-containing protein [Leptolyngbyaceae cyanobacterium bins.302]
MSTNPSDLQAIFDRIEAGKRLSQKELQLLVSAVRSQQVTIATGDRAVTVGGSADGAVIVTGDRNVVVTGADARAIRQLTEERPRAEEILLQTVKTEVSARLKQSLHNKILIHLGMEAQPDQVKRPWDSDIKIGGNPVEAIPEDWGIWRVFDEVQGKLLILGAPGAGKTTTMLELAQVLCDRAEQRANFPVPMLLNLSTWKQDKQLIRDWLIAELQSKYGIRREVSTKWLRDAKLLPMLDGLDELESSRQESCVRAINQFLQSEERSQYLVVCSRFEEYSNYKTSIQLNGAIYLRELTDQQIHNYLVRNSDSELWRSIRHDSHLLQLVRTPLLLSITTLAYADLSLTRWRQLSSTEARLEYLLNTYISRMLAWTIGNHSSNLGHSDITQTKKWLIWLAQQLQKQFQTEFLIENIQPTLLKTHRQKWLYSIINTFTIGLFLSSGYFLFDSYNSLSITFSVISLLIWILFSTSYNMRYKMVTELLLGFAISIVLLIGKAENFPIRWLFLMLILLCLCGVGIFSAAPTEIEPVETLKLSFRRAKKEISLCLLGGLSAILVVLTSFNIFGITSPIAILSGLSSGLGCGFLFLMVCGLTGRMIDSDIEIGVRPNQGIKKSAFNAVMATMLLGLIGGLGISLVFVPVILHTIGLPSEWGNLSMAIEIKLDPSASENLVRTLHRNQDEIPWAKDVLELSQRSILYLALKAISFISKFTYPFLIISIFSIGIVGGLTHGGIACVRHFTLRVILYCNHCIPWNYSRFLNYATERLLLQRIGGRYRFIHRLLQDHFAAMPLERIRGDR